MTYIRASQNVITHRTSSEVQICWYISSRLSGDQTRYLKTNDEVFLTLIKHFMMKDYRKMSLNIYKVATLISFELICGPSFKALTVSLFLQLVDTTPDYFRNSPIR